MEGISTFLACAAPRAQTCDLQKLALDLFEVMDGDLKKHLERWDWKSGCTGTHLIVRGSLLGRPVVGVVCGRGRGGLPAWAWAWTVSRWAMRNGEEKPIDGHPIEGPCFLACRVENAFFSSFPLASLEVEVVVPSPPSVYLSRICY